ncbi:hypothetical protein HK097_004189 [Rhizophlyctis rosea]|uniref:C2H2-type domain-containing protein n=1 Tax=Rhizophlyctis rosea TaxID=64517 RepID=A0AAD5SG52_9FUNG|nr:hypothetical protein HK097_004189 [Rhizophlyctis rosea]
MAKKKKRAELKPWCWYCNREFEDEKVLINHQKAKHFKCNSCGKKLNTVGGLGVHMSQVHKETLTSVPNALEGRTGVELEIFGMEGIPEEDLQAHIDEIEGKSGNKRSRTDSGPITEETLKKQLEQFKQQQQLLASGQIQSPFFPQQFGMPGAAGPSGVPPPGMPGAPPMGFPPGPRPGFPPGQMPPYQPQQHPGYPPQQPYGQPPYGMPLPRPGGPPPFMPPPGGYQQQYPPRPGMLGPPGPHAPPGPGFPPQGPPPQWGQPPPAGPGYGAPAYNAPPFSGPPPSMPSYSGLPPAAGHTQYPYGAPPVPATSAPQQPMAALQEPASQPTERLKFGDAYVVYSDNEISQEEKRAQNPKYAYAAED